jgi:hypothetical protein
MCQLCARGHLPWAPWQPLQMHHPVSSFFSLSNNLGNLLFARQLIQVASIDCVLGQ